MPQSNDTYLRLTKDDLRASRVLTLAVKFFGSSRPLRASDVQADLYPDLADDAFRRQFLRDRTLLATFGLVIREAEGCEDESLWQVDEQASYVQGAGIGAEDARMLYVLCHDMAFDQAFAYRDELRMALAKISQMYRGASIPHTDATPPAQRKLLATLVSAMGTRHGVQVTYTDATGARSQRTLGLYGSFGLRGNTYFVGARLAANGTATPDSIRTYRLDRFDKARELANLTYEVPLDFAVNDYERLPFQIGDTAAQALLRVSERPDREVQRAMASHGQVTAEGQGVHWRVPYSDVRALAAWSVASGLVPVEPQDLCDAWEQTIAATAQGNPHDATLTGSGAGSTPSPTTRRAGRIGSVATARNLIALATSLTHEGDVVTASNIASTLGISYDEARHLIALVSMAGGESADYLPVILGEQDEEVSLMEGAHLSARRVRLTHSETLALSAALSELGVSPDDPLAQTLADSFAAPSFTAQDLTRLLEAPSSGTQGEVLRLCSRAISAGDALAFVYTPVAGGQSRTRHVMPRRIRRSDDSWYLDALDLDRQAERVFRLDRMEAVVVREGIAHDVHEPAPQEPRQVTVRFADPFYLDLFHWEAMLVLERGEDGVIARLPHYGGSWLARHLAACAGTVQTSDAELAREITVYAESLL